MSYNFMIAAFPRASGHTEAVQRRLRQFQQRHPDNPWANYYYGFSLAQSPDQSPNEEELAEAVRLFRRAIALQPDLSETHYQLGVLLFEQRQWREAVPALEAAVRVKPDFVEAHYRLALAYQRVGNSAQAKATLARYRKLKERQDAELERRESQRTKFIYKPKP
jgi:tetratricopeptide (TPR) repeat protein